MFTKKDKHTDYENFSNQTAKPGQKPLQELDRYRYDEAPKLFAGDKPQREMDLDTIKTLVEWKL